MGVLLEPADPAVLRKAAEGLMQLTAGEYRVLRSVLAGKDRNEAGAELGLSPRSIDTYIQLISAKCHCSRAELAWMASELEAMPDVRAYLQSLPPLKSDGGRKTKQSPRPT